MKKFLTCLAILLLVPACEPTDQQRKKDKQLDRYYELEWVKCVNELGIEHIETGPIRKREHTAFGIQEERALSLGHVAARETVVEHSTPRDGECEREGADQH